MDDGSLFLVDEDQLHPFSSVGPLSDEVITALQNDLGVAVGETVLPIAHWEHDRTGPLSIALNFGGELVALVLGEHFADQESIISTLSTLEQWLAPMGLAELGDLSGDQAKFADGLRELSPHLQIELASMLRILLVNPPFTPNSESLRTVLPFSRVETLEIESFESHDGTVAIRKVHTLPDLIIEGHEATPGSPQVVHFESPSLSAAPDLENKTVLPVEAEESSRVQAVNIDLVSAGTAINLDSNAINLDSEATADANPAIDLTSEPPQSSWPRILRGSVYQATELPLYFDPTGAKVEALSNELFAVEAHIAIVVNLDHHVESPLETASLFRWNATVEQNETFHGNRLDQWKRTRTVHLFVECDAQPGDVFYVGRGKQLSQLSESDPLSIWFQMSPPLHPEHLAALQAGRLPNDQPSVRLNEIAQHRTTGSATIPEPVTESGASFSFGGQVDLTEPTNSGSHWVPNV